MSKHSESFSILIISIVKCQSVSDPNFVSRNLKQIYQLLFNKHFAGFPTLTNNFEKLCDTFIGMVVHLLPGKDYNLVTNSSSVIVGGKSFTTFPMDDTITEYNKVTTLGNLQPYVQSTQGGYKLNE